MAATSDLITKDIYKGFINKQADNKKLEKVGRHTILMLGFATWLICLPRAGTLGEVLNLAGAFVASAIWPIVLGLYQQRLSGKYAGAAMALGTTCGLIGYFSIGFYVGALISCCVSFIVCMLGLMLKDDQFDWNRLANMEK